ncbi:hypothetical protein VTJ04DRAFT_3215 [Mycothermus thermophilus]|uniref:uncharacterized protein n=1 Tax=Humicola insolens TaxID=85995 RepID=UPI003742AC28
MVGQDHRNLIITFTGPARHSPTFLSSHHQGSGRSWISIRHFKHISSPLRETDWGDHRHFTFSENLGHDITRSATRQADRPNITRSLTIISRARKPHNTIPVRQGPKSRLTTFELKFWQLFDTYIILQSNTAEAQRSAQFHQSSRPPTTQCHHFHRRRTTCKTASPSSTRSRTRNNIQPILLQSLPSHITFSPTSTVNHVTQAASSFRWRLTDP